MKLIVCSAFSLTTFSQILTVAPEYYIHYWLSCGTKQSAILMIGIPEDFIETMKSLPLVLIHRNTKSVESEGHKGGEH